MIRLLLSGTFDIDDGKSTSWRVMVSAAKSTFGKITATSFCENDGGNQFKERTLPRRMAELETNKVQITAAVPVIISHRT